MKKPIIFLLVLITNILFISAQKISKTELKDKIAGAWIGQMVGNIYGLPFENKFVDEPAPESRFPFGYTKNIDKLQKYNGAFSDDDTDVEYIYLLLMEKYGVEPTYANMREGWMYHIRDRVWLANRAALGLMHLGFTPPFTGDENLNPHWYQIDPQLINEIWAYTAPGMISYAAGKSDWAARITSDSWAVSPTVLYGAMYADAFFCKDIRKLITRALKELPADDRYAIAVKEMIALYDKYPKDWVKARQIMAKKYYIDEPAMTKTIWNANLNGLCGILAMLYGEGDFQRTLDLSCAMGFDCDNQAATISGLLGVMYGAKSLPESLTKPIEGWEKPFNDRYINITRFDMPDASIEDMIERTYNKAIELVCAKGGKVKGDMVYVNPKAQFIPPMEFCIGPNPDLEIGQPTDYSFACRTNADFKWELVKGKFRRRQRHINWLCPGQDRVRAVVLVKRREDNDLVPRVRHGHHGGHHRLGAAAGHNDLIVGVNCPAHIAGLLGGQRLAEVLRAPGDGVLVVVLVRDLGQTVQNCFGRVKIREALGKVHRAVLVGDTGHAADDGIGKACGTVRKRLHW